MVSSRQNVSVKGWYWWLGDRGSSSLPGILPGYLLKRGKILDIMVSSKCGKKFWKKKHRKWSLSQNF
jgi:hypothetical protein